MTETLDPRLAPYVLAHSHSWEPRERESARGFKVIGHRGAAGHAPENTFAAFDRGLELGVFGVETDLRATRDGEVVLMHDATVDRTTNGTGAVADLTWAELRALDAAAKFHEGKHDFGEQRVLRLDEFLDRYAGRTTYRLEIKARGVEDAALRAVRARSLMDHVVFTSFSLDSVRALRRAAPEAQVAHLSSAPFDDASISAAVDAGANEIAPRAERVTKELVARAEAAGLRVWAWGIKEPGHLRVAVDAGIGGCTLDHPDWADALQQT
jgi:glycerophosphoryl diester phosphodiesterase